MYEVFDQHSLIGIFTGHKILRPGFFSWYMDYNIGVDYFRYANLLDCGNQRRDKIQESCKAYQLVREAAELAAWITEKENLMVAEDVGEDLEQVEEMQKKFDDFRKV